MYTGITLMAIYATLMSFSSPQDHPDDVRVPRQALFKKLDLSGDEEIEYSHLARLHRFRSIGGLLHRFYWPFSSQHVTIIGNMVAWKWNPNHPENRVYFCRWLAFLSTSKNRRK